MTDTRTAPQPVAAATDDGEAVGLRAPLAYHRLAHLEPRTARWWRPFATLGVAAGLLLALAVGLGLVAAIVVLVVLVLSGDWASFPSALAPSDTLEDPRNPMDHLLGLGSVAILLPVVLLGLRWGGGRARTVHSVTGRFRWRTALRAGAVVLPLYALVYWTLMALDPPEDLSMPSVDASLLAVVLVVLLLGPLQCAAEEYAFRGLPMQVFGTWLRRPVVGVVLPVPLFVLGHGTTGRPDRPRRLRPDHGLPGVEERRPGAGRRHAHREQPAALPRLPLSPSSLHQGAVDPVWMLVNSRSCS
jgi:hypothetical protein